MGTGPEKKKSRRDQILDAAFAIAATDLKWSMTGIARRVGVTKTALYRHFENRAEIEEAMNGRFFDEFTAMLNREEVTGNDLRRATVAFFRQHPEYLTHVMYLIITDQEFLGSVFARLRKGNALIREFFDHIEGLPAEKRTAGEINILKNWVSLLIISFPVPEARGMQDKLLEVLDKGLYRLATPDDARLAELGALAFFPEDMTAGTNRLIDATAAAIREYGLAKTTIETIAEKMGTAKSSLYFYGKNKREMLASLVESQMTIVAKRCSELVPQGKTIAEQLFISMMVEANYLILKPNLIPVFNWIRYETMQNPEMYRHSDPDIAKLIGKFRGDELVADPEIRETATLMTLKWALALSSSCIIRGKEEGLDDDRLRENIRTMLKSMIAGDGI